MLATLFSMVFGELVPQFLGISAPLSMAALVAPPVRLFALLMRPLIVVLNGSANAMLESFGMKPQEELSAAPARRSWPRSSGAAPGGDAG